MSIRVKCSHCGKVSKVDDDRSGTIVACPGCGSTVHVPDVWTPPADGTASTARRTHEVTPSKPRARPDVVVKLRALVWSLTLMAGLSLLVCVGCLGVIGFQARKQAANQPPRAQRVPRELVNPKGESVIPEIPLEKARREHPTKLMREGPAPQEFDDEMPEGVERVTFDSDGRTLFGWLGKPAGDGPFPAVLHAHGGFALGPEDFEQVRPLVQAGYVVLVPAWRGENGNPGDFELCYGEVDDALAALEYLAALPEVDPQRLFATGHSVGGTAVMLLAELTPKLRGAMACGGIPDMQTLFKHGFEPNVLQVPFDALDEKEGDLRSPARHAGDLKCPLLLCYGADPEDRISFKQAQAFKRNAAEVGKEVRVETFLATDHMTSFAPALNRCLEFFEEIAPAANNPAAQPAP
jgi:dienelactone hydrolase